MAQFQVLQLWTDAYLYDTRHLTQAQHGCYLLLLMTAWRTPDCSLPDNDNLLARYVGADMRTWLKQKSVVLAFWTLGNDGRWRHKRLSTEREYLVQRACKRAESGRRGGLARAAANSLRNNEIPQANLPVCSSRNQAPTPTPIYSEGDKSPSAAAGAAGLSVGNRASKDKPLPESMSASPDPQKAVFDYGKTVLGRNAGGQITNLIKRHGGALDAAMRTLHLAAGKSAPREYLAAVLRAPPEPELDELGLPITSAGALGKLYADLGPML
ncbi:MAG: hypothetical protein FD149_396 [Rhodospirillaceae bacterium]|nr:MAG: hypothetical protein FD149_396 [Rhodospirillaceae bacterium]